MERLAILVNDAAHAERLLRPMLAGTDLTGATLVLCPPKLTHRVGKWLSNRQRLQWQRTWSQDLRRALNESLPELAQHKLDWMTASTRLNDTTSQLRRERGVDLRVLDLRRPTLGHTLPPPDPAQVRSEEDRWAAPVAVTSSLSLVLTLVD